MTDQAKIQKFLDEVNSVIQPMLQINHYRPSVTWNTQFQVTLIPDRFIRSGIFAVTDEFVAFIKGEIFHHFGKKVYWNNTETVFWF